MRWIFIGMILLNALYFSWHQYGEKKSDNTVSQAWPTEEASVKTLTLLSEQALPNPESEE